MKGLKLVLRQIRMEQRIAQYGKDTYNKRRAAARLEFTTRHEQKQITQQDPI